MAATLNGDAGNDVIDATSLTQTVPLALGGGVGNDTITGGPGVDTITAGAGDDTIFWSAGTDSIDGGNAGAGDTLIFRGNAAANALTIQQLAAANMISVTFDARTGTDTLTSLESIRVELLDNNDAFTIDLPNAQLITAAPLFYDGGAGRDTLTVQGTFGGGNGVDRTTYSPGLQPDEGRLLYEEGLIGAPTQSMDVKFDNLEPLVDVVAGAMLTVEGPPASNAIAYRQGSLTTRGLVTIDNFESIEFSGKANLTVNGNAGDDAIVADNTATPTGLTSLTLNADAGNDEVRIENLPAAVTVLVNDAARAGSGDGNDVIDVSQNPNATATTLNGGAGIDTITGGLGVDVINAGSGNDIIVSSPVPAASTDTIDGGTGDDQFNIIGRILNDTITAVQASATALNVSYNGVARNNTLATAGGIPTIEKVFIDGDSGDDLIAISVADIAVLADAASLPFDVVGNSPNASDRLVVNDDGTGDLVINRQGPDGRSGSVTVGGKPPVTYTAVERVDITPLVVLPPPTPGLTPGTGVTANGGRVITFRYDNFESNDTITDATALGADPTFINQRNIDPGGVVLGPPFGTIPGDADWFEFRPDHIGTFRFDVLFEQIATVPSGRTGLPGNGDLRLDIYRPDGTLIASSNSSAATTLNVDTSESVSISVAANTSYFVRVSGATAPAINTYTLNVSNADELGPQVFDPDDAGPLAAIFPNNLNTYNLFNRKPEVDGPTPLVFSLTVNLRDLPVRFPGDLYPALDAIASSNPGLFTVTGDHVGLVDIRNIAVVNEPQANYAFNGMVTVAGNASMFTVGPLTQVPRIGDNITFTSGPAANETRQITAFNPATGLITVNAPFSAAPAATNTFLITSFPEAQIILTFSKPLPDDRYTLRILDGVVDPAGNALDGESNAAEPNNPTFPSGNGIPGGDFVARFTVDSRPELGAAVGGDIDLDTNGNFVWDPANSQIGNDATNVDLSFTLLVQNGVSGPLAPGGFNVNDLMFGGKFTNPPAGGALPPRLFDQLAAFGFAGDLPAPGFRWLIDTTGDGVITVGTTDLLRLQATTVYPANQNPFNVSGAIPIAGNFDGNAANGDEIGLYSGGRFALDTNRSFNIDANDAFINTNMMGAPIVGDFDGNGKDDLAVFNNNVFYFALNPAFANSSIVFNSALTVTWGFAGTLDKPVATDMDGDGVDDIGLWEPRTSASLPREVAEWYFLVSGARLATVVVPPGAAPPTVNTFFAPALGTSPIAAGTLIRVTGANGVTQFGQVQTYNTATGQLTVTGLTTAPAAGDIVSVGGVANTLNLLNHAFNTAPFGNDIVAEFGDEQALPILGNFDPPATPTIVLPPASTTTADVTHDGRIDGADFLSWQRSLGATGAAAAAGDADGNNVVNYSDLATWKQQFGLTTTGPTQTVTVTSASSASLVAAETTSGTPAVGGTETVKQQAPAARDGASLAGVAQTVAQSTAANAAPTNAKSQAVDHAAQDAAFTRWRPMTTLPVLELGKITPAVHSVEQRLAAVDHVLAGPVGRSVRPLSGSGRLLSGLRLR
jgi:Ca2+-binding RTX toxin-like protein